jgi:protein-disulfide isomerase
MPHEGADDAPVTFVEIFDPNCPHCKTLWETVNEEFKEAHPQTRFYMVPYPLWDFSLGQVAALRLSREEGRFPQMVEQLFTRQAGRGMTLDQVVEAASAAGVNGPNLRRQLTDNVTLDPLLQQILAHRDYVTGAVTPDRSMSVPKVLINGRVLAPDPQWGYTRECLDRLITEAAAAE